MGELEHNWKAGACNALPLSSCSLSNGRAGLVVSKLIQRFSFPNAAAHQKLRVLCVHSVKSAPTVSNTRSTTRNNSASGAAHQKERGAESERKELVESFVQRPRT